MIEYIPLILVVVSLIIISILVLIKNYKSKINMYFALLSLTLASWLTVSYLEDDFSINIARLLVRLDFLLAVLLATTFVLLFINFPFKENKKIKDRYVFIVAIPMFIAVFSPSLIRDISPRTAGGYEFLTGFLYVPFLVVFGLFIFLGVISLYLKYRKSKGVQRQQIQYVFTGATVTALLLIFFTAVLPRFIEVSTTFNRLGLFSSIIFIFFLTFAIVKHKLMDIRMVVARSFAYIILLAILAGLYAGSVFGLERIFFPNEYNNFILAQGVLRTAITVAMVFIFQPLKKWVTQVTDKIFFKNSYNQDVLLSELSHTLGSTIVLIEMLYRVSDILTTQMKVSRTLFALVKDENRLYTVQANGYKETPDVDPIDIQHITKDGLMVADELEDNSRHKRLLRSYDAAIAVPLKTDKEVVGVLFLGEKSSGDMYSQQDLSILEILAPEISVAIENAKSYEEINRFNVTLRQEIKRATYRLKEKNSQLMELDKAKDEFISMASHQLRTPLTAIKGYLSMLLEGDAGDIKVSQYDFINEAYSGANRMVGLINDLLNVSRMETGRFFLEPREIDIERVVNEEVKQLSNSAKNKGLFLTVEKKGNVPHIWADETKIRQVIMNFMDNAIYYTNTGGVTVRLRSDKTNFYYEVHDTGIGVPKTQRDQLFQKFFRADNARTARPDGTGLGIYLARRVIEDHGGEIIFDSTEGKGSVFGFKFPLKKKVSMTPVSAPEPRPSALATKIPTATEVAEQSTE